MKSKERCQYELHVEKYFGLPGDVSPNFPFRNITYSDLVALLSSFHQSLPSIHTTSQVLKIAGEAWDTALSDQCDVNTYLTQLKSQLKK